MRILRNILVLLFVTTAAVGQQINPVPDYIFRNQMSVGRNAPTDTAAYLSIGPRFGANRGIMPPMVVDTNAVTGVKRNGLLIFSVQLNNFAYWDSTTSRFRRITAEAVVDSLQFATRAWRRKGDDSLAAIINQRTDTALLSTKAYRQKGVDSLVTLISTLGGGTVLSVSAGTGMNFTTITTSGSVSADTNVLSTRAWRRKGDDSLGAVIAGKVNISDTATMLSAYLRKADTTSMLSPYLRKADTTAMLAPYVRNAGFGLTKGTQTLSVDSALMATRARVQKGIDSVASLVTTIDSLTFSTRAWRQKGVDSVAALANTKATATGTTNYLSKFTGTNSLGNSIVYATTSEVGISTPSPTESLDVNGRVRVRTIDSTATGMNMLYADATGVIKKAAVPAGGSGTVTSVAAGTGMSFTTITTTGSVSADTVALATRAWRQKGIDSLANVRVGGSGTTNRVAKFTASGTVGDGIMVDNGTGVSINNSVIDVPFSAGTSGITPVRIGGNIGGNYSLISMHGVLGSSNYTILGDSANGDLVFNRRSNGYMDFRRANSSEMRIFNNGRIGIGTVTDAGYRVDIAGTLRSTQGANFATSSGQVVIGATTSPSSAQPLVISSAALGNGQPSILLTSPASTTDQKNTVIQSGSALSDALRFRFVNDAATDGTNAYIITRSGTQAQTHEWITGTNERMRITSGGNVGIGTTSPDSRLSVIGDGTGIIRMGSGVGGNSATIGLTGAISSTNYTLSGDAGNSNLAINRPTGGAMSFRSNGSAQMTLTSAGRLLIGTETEGTNTVDINGTLRTVNGANFATTSGSVGIGTTSPTTTLDVRGAGYFETATNGTNYTFTSGASVVNNAFDVDLGKGGGAYNYLKFKWNQGNVITWGGSLSDYANKLTLNAPSGANAALELQTLNITAIKIDSAQSVGIGGITASTSTRLDVNGRIRARTIDSTSSPINMLTSDVNGVIRKAAIPTAASVDTNTIATRARVQKAVDSINNVNASGTGISGYINRWSGTKTMDTSQIFQQANRIGIGTTTPDARLVVVGDGTGLIRIGGGVGGNTASIGMTGAISSTTYTLAGDPGTGNVTLNRPSGGALSFAHANTEQARFDGNGTFLINTTTSDANVRLRVNGRARVETIDSSAGPINMLWADNNGVIRKAAVPSGGGGSGTVTSVATGFGIDGGTITTTGTLTADTFEVASRLRLYKVADSLAALSRITGSGTANYVPLFTSSTAVGNSSIFEQSSEVRIGTTSDAGAFRLQVNGVTYSSGGIRTDAPSGGTAQTWKFGSAIADSVALDANNYLEVEVNGVFYRIALITLL